MESESSPVGRVKAAAARYLGWGALIVMVGAMVVAWGCDSLLFHVRPAADRATACLVFVLALISCCWAICVLAFERRRPLLRIAIRCAQGRLGDRQEQPAPAVGGHP